MELDLPGGGREKSDTLTRLLEGAFRPTLKRSHLPPPAIHSPGVRLGVRPALCDLLAARMGEGAGPVASFALRCQRAIGALGMGASSLSSECKSLSNTNCAMARLRGRGPRGDQAPDLVGLLGSACHSSHQPGTSLYSALPNTSRPHRASVEQPNPYFPGPTKGTPDCCS